MWYSIFIIVLGLLALPHASLSKKLGLGKYIEQITPYKGYFGIGAVIYGIFGVLSILGSFSLLGAGIGGIITFILMVAVVVVQLWLWFIFGYDLIAKHVLSKSEAAKKKWEEMLKKLLPLQNKLGNLALYTGIIYLIFYILARYVFRFM